eukprot:4079687-Amphidinium_carterae.2
MTTVTHAQVKGRAAVVILWGIEKIVVCATAFNYIGQAHRKTFCCKWKAILVLKIVCLPLCILLVDVAINMGGMG